MHTITARELNQMDARGWQEILSGPPETALRWLCAAAEQGVIEAQVHLAQRYLEGRGCDADPAQAVPWLRLAANEGHAMGMNLLGRCYENAWGLKKDAVMATYWFRHAALAGLDWGLYNYATSLALGRGTPVNHVQARVFFQQAADQGHAKSWNFLGSFHEDGWAGERDLEQALSCYLRAAQGKDFRGAFNAARLMADQGRGDEALPLLQVAWHEGHAAFRTQMQDFMAMHFPQDWLKAVCSPAAHQDTRTGSCSSSTP